MSYPFSITKNASFKLSEQQDLSGLIIAFNTELKKLHGTTTRIEDQSIKIIECDEFSSRALRTRNLNKGRILFSESNGIVFIESKIFLIEHLLIFSTIVIVFGVFGIASKNGLLDSMIIVAVMLLTLYVFCYLFPLNTYYSFFNKTIDKVSRRKTLKQTEH